MLRAYWPLWAGAVGVGLIVGIGPKLLPSTPTAIPDPPREIGIETALEEKPSLEDQAWAARAEDDAEAAAEAAYAGAVASPRGVAATFGFCHTGGGTNCVVDGDTIWIEGQKVRVADIDAPETHDYRCPEEKALGQRATQRLIQLVNSGPVTLQPFDRDEDRYGRKLRNVFVNGVSVGDTLVSEGLARPYGGGRKPWC